MAKVHVLVKEAEVGGTPGGDFALAFEFQRLCNVARQKRKRRLHRDVELSDEALKVAQVTCNAANTQAHHFALFVKARDRAVAVRAHREMIGRNACFERFKRRVRRSGKSAGPAGRDVHVAARNRKLHSALKDRLVARAVRRTDVTDRKAALHDIPEDFKGPGDVPEVNVQNTEFSGHHRAHADLREKPQDFVFAREA